MRVGAWAWLGCLQFFVAEQVARLGWLGHYSMQTNFISDLGATGCAVNCSHWHSLMNGSFLLQGVLIAAGACLLPRRFSPGVLGVVARVLLLLAAWGVLVVGSTPEDVNMNLHIRAARLYFGSGSLGMLFWGLAGIAGRHTGLPVAVRAAFAGAGVAVLGDVLLSAGSGPLQGALGVGVMERLAAYPLPLWLAWTGWAAWAGIRASPVGADGHFVAASDL